VPEFDGAPLRSLAGGGAIELLGGAFVLGGVCGESNRNPIAFPSEFSPESDLFAHDLQPDFGGRAAAATWQSECRPEVDGGGRVKFEVFHHSRPDFSVD
jgi:hypothetical protein